MSTWLVQFLGCLWLIQHFMSTWLVQYPSQVLMKWWDQLQTPQELHQPSAHEMVGSATDTPGTAPAKCS